jgi:hypothetical protein
VGNIKNLLEGLNMNIQGVTTICGSMRYYGMMLRKAEELTRQGWIVLMPFADVRLLEMPEAELSHIKSTLDRMHFIKIDMSNAIHVVGLHRGESTMREIEYARSHGKKVYE